jgi:hypothetical protein
LYPGFGFKVIHECEKLLKGAEKYGHPWAWSEHKFTVMLIVHKRNYSVGCEEQGNCYKKTEVCK